MVFVCPIEINQLTIIYFHERKNIYHAEIEVNFELESKKESHHLEQT